MKIKQFVEHKKVVGDYVVFTRVLSFSPEENDDSEILEATERFLKEHIEQPYRIKDERRKIICRKYADVIRSDVFDAELNITFHEIRREYFDFMSKFYSSKILAFTKQQEI